MGGKRKRALQPQEAPQSGPAAVDLAGVQVEHEQHAAAQDQVQPAEGPLLAQQLEDMIVQILQTRKAGATC